MKKMLRKYPTYFKKWLLVFLVNTLCEAKHSKLKSNLALGMFIENHKNAVISPLMIRFPLCKLASVAQGRTKSDLLLLLEMKTNEVPSCYTQFKNIFGELKNMDFLTLNKIVVNYTDDFNPQFIANSTNYGVRVDRVGFSYPNLAVSFINRWVEKATYKRVSDLLVPGDINSKTSMIIVNAAYLKVTWEFPFNIKSTKEKKFRDLAGRVSDVPMMTKTESCLYLNDETSHTEYITMKLASFGITMTFMIPQSIKGLPELLQMLLREPDYLNGVRKRMQYKIIKITLPRFKIKTGVELNEYLRKAGASIILDETNSGLNAILKNDSATTENMYVSKIKQKNFIDVDEMGIFRQLPREMYDELTGPSNVGNEVIFDHPFYFTVNIDDAPNNKDIYNMFQGVYYGPEE